MNRATVTLLLSLFAATPLSAERMLTYDPSLGTLPEAQGWSLVESGTHPAPFVSGGVLHQGLTTGPSQFWTGTYSTPADFSIDTITMEARLHVLSSDLGFPGGKPRTGYFITVRDQTGRLFLVGMGTDRVILRNSSGASSAVGQHLFDTTDGFHDYQLVVDSSGAQLSVDGSFVLSMPLGPTEPGTVANFGAVASGFRSETDLAYLTISNQVVVPEPSTFALVAFGFVALAAWGWRRKRQTL